MSTNCISIADNTLCFIHVWLYNTVLPLNTHSHQINTRNKQTTDVKHVGKFQRLILVLNSTEYAQHIWW